MLSQMSVRLDLVASPAGRAGGATRIALSSRDELPSFDKIESALDFTPEWTVRRSVAEMLEAYRAIGLTIDEFRSPRFLRLARVKQLVAEGVLGDDLRRRAAPVAS